MILKSNKRPYQSLLKYHGSYDSSVSFVTKLRSISGKGNRLLSSPKRPDKLRGPPSLLFKENWGIFPGDKAVGTQNFQ